MLVATDGLWDNVDLKQIVYCVTSPERKVAWANSQRVCTYTDTAKCGQVTVLMSAYGKNVNV